MVTLDADKAARLRGKKFGSEYSSDDSGDGPQVLWRWVLLITGLVAIGAVHVFPVRRGPQLSDREEEAERVLSERFDSKWAHYAGGHSDFDPTCDGYLLYKSTQGRHAKNTYRFQFFDDEGRYFICDLRNLDEKTYLDKKHSFGMLESKTGVKHATHLKSTRTGSLIIGSSHLLKRYKLRDHTHFVI